MPHNNIYSTEKIFGFPAKIASFRSGVITAPIYVRIKPTNRCQHSCQWCLVAGTKISTPKGYIPIEGIRTGDVVFSPDGKPANVAEVGKRRSESIVRIICDGRTIEASPDHPFLTENGWNEAGSIRVGDRAVVRVGERNVDAENVQILIAGIELERGLELRSVESVVILPGQEVFNLSCEPLEAYEANGFVVHNCVYSDGTKRPKDAGADKHLQSHMHETMREHDQMPVAKALELLDDLRDMGTKAVTFSGGGEPLIHPEICLIMSRALENNLDISIITNGQSLSGPRAEILAKAKWVRISIDYTSAEQMMASRHTPERFFGDVLKNIEAFSKSKDSDCDLGVNFIVTRENHADLIRFGWVLKGIGIENIRFSPVYCQGFREYHLPIHAAVEAQLRELQSICDDDFTINSTYDIDSDSKKPVRPFCKCLYQETVPVVGADLNVFRCHNVSYASHGIIGSIANRSFRDLWFSPEARENMKGFDPSKACLHECANQQKVVLFNRIAEMPSDNFV